jgi:hypothetical protein
LEEADESLYWLEAINEAEIRKGIEVNKLIDEANQLNAFLLQQKNSQIETK